MRVTNGGLLGDEEAIGVMLPEAEGAEFKVDKVEGGESRVVTLEVEGAVLEVDEVESE